MVTLRPHGSARFFSATFLGLWLCGWLAGECFALYMLGNAAVSLISGSDSGPMHLKQGSALAMGGFVLIWLTVWTVAGLAAMTEFFRLICGEDRVSAENGSITIEGSRGPFHSRREIPRETLRRLLLTGRGALAVETATGQVELSHLGTPEERQAALQNLTAQLKLPEIDPVALAAVLPQGWEEIITPEGERAVIPDRAARLKRDPHRRGSRPGPRVGHRGRPGSDRGNAGNLSVRDPARAGHRGRDHRRGLAPVGADGVASRKRARDPAQALRLGRTGHIPGARLRAPSRQRPER
jgi:hypothetical protein